MVCKRCGFDFTGLEAFEPRYCIRCGEKVEQEPEPAEKKVLTVDEVSEILRLTKGSVYQYIRRGKIPYFKVGRILRFDREKIDELRGQKSREKELQVTR